MSSSLIPNWNQSTIANIRALPAFNTIQGLRNREILEYHERGCLSNTDLPKHSINIYAGLIPGVNILNGTTVWINEYMAVGHMMYDLFLLEALRATRVDRIVLQRAPCSNSDLCHGMGTWRSYYQLFYAIAIDAFQPGIPLYFRFQSNQMNLRPTYLTLNTDLDSNECIPEMVHENVSLRRIMCFERLIRRKCATCFYSGVSPETVTSFKAVAYRTVKSRQLEHTFTQGSAIKILLAYRAGLSGRNMENVPFLVKNLQLLADSPKFNLQTRCTSSESLGAAEQIEMVAENQIVISEHGAFQSNMIYMRKGSLFIELRGNYSSDETQNFEEVARLFGVFYAVVVVGDLKEHRGNFNISASESEQVVSIVQKYASDAPFKVNVK